MSKNFEKELNQMLDDQIPDLWNRIEPQLHDKTPSGIKEDAKVVGKEEIVNKAVGKEDSKEIGKEEIVGKADEKEDSKEIGKEEIVSKAVGKEDSKVVNISEAGKRKFFTKRNMTIASSVAAAIVVVGISIPIITSLVSSRSKPSSFHSAAATSETAAPESFYESDYAAQAPCEESVSQDDASNSAYEFSASKGENFEADAYESDNGIQTDASAPATDEAIDVTECETEDVGDTSDYKQELPWVNEEMTLVQYDEHLSFVIPHSIIGTQKEAAIRFEKKPKNQVLSATLDSVVGYYYFSDNSSPGALPIGQEEVDITNQDGKAYYTFFYIKEELDQGYILYIDSDELSKTEAITVANSVRVD